MLPNTKHFQSEGLTADINNNLSERLQGAYRDRIKTLRGLENLETGQRYLDGWTLNYNLFRKHHSLRNQTPGYRAKVNPPFSEWADVVKGGTTPQVFPKENIIAPPEAKPQRPKARHQFPKIQPPKCGARQAKETATSPIPPSAFAGIPRAMRPKPPKPGRKSRMHSVA